MAKWVYTFGDGEAEGRATDKNLLGGKGANLAEMSSLGLPVPPGFTITADACNHYYANGKSHPAELEAQVATALAEVGRVAGRRFGDPDNLLLVSVRSGARASMPGMMDTVLNLGLNDVTVQALARDAHDARFAYDSYRRFIQMYSDVVLGLDHEVFEEILEDEKANRGYDLDTEFTAADWQGVIALYKAKVEEELERPFPQDPDEQLWGAIGAVFSSWMNTRAITYRRLHGIPEVWGTAVNIQAMVFGNMGDTSATGVAFTRNPSTGEKALYGEFLVNAQGEDVVAGIRTPQNITEKARIAAGSDKPSLQKLMPEAFARLHRHLRAAGKALPRHAGHRIHHRARQIVDAADALRQAHREGGAEDRGRHGARRADQQRARPSPASTRPRSTSCCTRPSTRAPSARSSAPACPPRRGRPPARSCSPPRMPRTREKSARR